MPHGEVPATVQRSIGFQTGLWRIKLAK